MFGSPYSIHSLLPNKMSTVWEPKKVVESLYTGGKIEVSKDETKVFCLRDGTVISWDIKNLTVNSLEGEDLGEFTINQKDELITVGVDRLIRGNTESGFLLKSDCVATCIASDPKGVLIATGGADNSVRVYQITQGYLTHCFKQHRAPVLNIVFHPSLWKIASSSHDYTVKVFDLEKYECLHSIRFEHPVRYLFLLEKSLITGTEDDICQFSLKTYNKRREFKPENNIESLDLSGEFIFTGDNDGNIQKLRIKQFSLKKEKNITQFSINYIKATSSWILASNQEQTMYLLSHKLKVLKEFIGHLDEILDVKLISPSCVLLALNSSEPKFFDLETSETVSLKSHTDLVLCLDILGPYILTGAKDNLLIYWENTTPICRYHGHTTEVTSVALTNKSILASGSIDATIKIWRKGTGDVYESLWTISAHERDLNCVRFTPGSKFIASASSDKVIKIWDRKLKLRNSLEGHRRGVWDLSFHASDKILVSASADRTIKLWNYDKSDCIRTLEGHENSVLKVIFYKNVLISTGSDGMIKIWNYKSGNCMSTLDLHTEKVWSLDGLIEERLLITGGNDSKLILWEDVTAQKEKQHLTENREKIKKEHDIVNMLNEGNRVEAGLIAFEMSRPEKLHKILIEMDDNDKVGFIDRVLEVPEGVEKLMKHIRDWNSLKKFSFLAQSLLHELFERVPYNQFPDMTETLSEIKIYSEKHYSRVEKLLVECFSLEHLLNEISLVPVKRPRGVQDGAQQKVKIN